MNKAIIVPVPKLDNLKNKSSSVEDIVSGVKKLKAYMGMNAEKLRTIVSHDFSINFVYSKSAVSFEVLA
jgi:hypothetical protein